VAAGTQTALKIAHHDLGSGAMIELVIRDQDLHLTDLANFTLTVRRYRRKLSVV
jgi:hypothetical protein